MHLRKLSGHKKRAHPAWLSTNVPIRLDNMNPIRSNLARKGTKRHGHVLESFKIPFEIFKESYNLWSFAIFAPFWSPKQIVPNDRLKFQGTSHSNISIFTRNPLSAGDVPISKSLGQVCRISVTVYKIVFIQYSFFEHVGTCPKFCGSVCPSWNKQLATVNWCLEDYLPILGYHVFKCYVSFKDGNSNFCKPNLPTILYCIMTTAIQKRACPCRGNTVCKCSAYTYAHACARCEYALYQIYWGNYEIVNSNDMETWNIYYDII